jgi:hypothetical protein
MPLLTTTTSTHLTGHNNSHNRTPASTSRSSNFWIVYVSDCPEGMIALSVFLRLIYLPCRGSGTRTYKAGTNAAGESIRLFLVER